ncbi:MAG: hypothetical protein LBU12_02300 [Deltaproteobacteria bacterium]|jgi:hypothetical protein|nr:hypothetical protein [Deltaproteobacteria bacterium]
MAEHYSPSGNFSPSALFLIPFVSALVTVVLSLPYAWAVWRNPLLYLGVLLPIAWGFVVGSASGWAAKVGKVRSASLGVLLTLLGILPGFALQWAFYVAVVLVSSDAAFDGVSLADKFKISLTSGVDLLLGHDALPSDMQEIDVEGVLSMGKSSPTSGVDLLRGHDALVSYMQEINAEGVWSVGKSSPTVIKGVPLLLVWIAEFLVFVVTAAIRVLSQVKKPFNEDFAEWYERVPLPKTLVLPEDPTDLLVRSRSDEYSYLFTAPRETDVRNSHLKAELHYLQEAPDNYLTVQMVTVKKKKSVKATLIDRLAIPKLQADRLIARLGPDAPEF